MKKILFFVCTLLCANVLLAQVGTTFWIGDLGYEVISTNPAEVEVKDANADITTANIPSTVSYEGTTYSVTSIGSYAFYYCSRLTSVTIPNSVTSIGNWAFDSCSSLTSIDIPNSLTSIGISAFRNCSSLTSVTIPNSVTSIQDAAFSFCSSLTSVILSNNANIHSDAFKNTGGIKVGGISYGGKETVNIGNYTFNNVGFITFYLNENATTITPSEVSVIDCDESLSGDIVIPSILSYEGINYSVTSIGIAAFEYCDGLTSVTIPNSVTSIGYAAFEDCDGLTSVTIPNSVTSIGGYAFYACNSLTSVTIPNSVTSIEYGAFSSCSSLTSITIPNSVTSIGSYAFYRCDDLTSVTIGNSVTSIGNWAFEYCTSLTSVAIPNSVTSIGARAFADCDGLTSVTIGNSVTSIEGHAFYACNSLTSVTIPNSVTSIENRAFSDCSSLTSVILPNNANISSSAFENTGGINVGGIYYRGKGTVNIGNYTFNNVGFIKFYLNGNVTTITPSEVSVIDCDESLSGDIVIPSILNYGGTTYTVTFIAGKAFYNKDNLTSVTIPNTVTAIGTSTDTYGAFEECNNLTSVTIPNSVTSIGKYTFYSCDNLTSVTCLKETVPSLGNNVFASTPSTKVLNIPFGSDYSSWQGATTWSKTNYLIKEGERKELSNDFTINSTTGLINEGVLRIKQSGQLINKTSTNVGGIVEIETPTLANNKWSFIGAPFNNYKLEAVKPGTEDISISLFDYETGNWSEDFATIEDVVGAGEGFFAWSFAAEPTVFTTYGDGAETYNFETPPAYSLNNGRVEVEKNLTTNAEGGNWLALSNPYTFKLDVEEFLSEHGDIKGGVVYRFNGSVWTPVSEGEINMTEGFFVNFENPGTHGVFFSKSYIYEPAKSKAIESKDYITLNVAEGENVSKLRFAQNPKAKQGDDLFDANKLFSPLEITEPYFVTDGVALVKEEVKEYPYTATLNIRNYETKEVTISIDNIPEGVNVFLLDNGQDIKMNGGVEYTTTITEGENADRFKVLFKKQHRLEKINDNQITITNNNRQISVKSDKTDLNIEVYNALGQKVFSTNEYNFTLSTQPAGSYVIKAYQGRYSKSKKIVIE